MQSPVVRIDPYRSSHKGIRLLLDRLLEGVGRADFADAPSVVRVRRELDAAVDILRTHARIEVQYLDALLGAHAPREAGDVQREHLDLERELFEVTREIHLLEAVSTIEHDDDELRERGHAFYLALSRFVARYFVHMADEETCVLPLLRRYVDGAVLRRAIVAAQQTIPLDERRRLTALVAEASNERERRAIDDAKPRRSTFEEAAPRQRA